MPHPSPSALDALVRTATGPAGLAVVFGFSFLVAVALPLPGELVLAAPLDLGLSPAAELAVVVAVSAAGKALGSVAALHVGSRATGLGPLSGLAGDEGPAATVAERFRRLADDYGYLGLAATLSVPFAPDTASVYAFSVAETDHSRFAAAAFVGTVVRLSVVAGVVGGLLALL